ncbi:hypothetical protein SCHPADRAFT_997597 [Schizopora paradoxa]|uniref:F-box domain-containing protein n=1 Tax=Schizopora paradoxa TaxID=27342 RepID=A0A0H2RNH3_9AGAM|nr:hypothetical protein SCHPADRAFT_997597 [Schizopora paradoxa]
MPIFCASDSQPSNIRDVLASLGCVKDCLPNTPVVQTYPETKNLRSTSPPNPTCQSSHFSDEWCTPLEDRAFMALRIILDGVETASELRTKEGLTRWLEEIAVVPFEPATLGDSYGDRNIIWRAKRSCDALEIAANLAQRLSSTISEQATRMKCQVEALSLQYGISSLPDDILSDILVHATAREDEHDGMSLTEREERRLHTAIELSHVCSRFRSLLLDRARIWGFLSSDISNIEMTRHCIKYAKSAPLKVHMENLGSSLSKDGFQHFITACLESAENWNHLTMRLPYFKTTTEEETARFECMLDNVSSFSRLSDENAFCSLVSLEIRFDGPFGGVNLQDKKFHPYLRWSLPSLTRFSLLGTIPFPFKNNIKHLRISYAYERGQSLDLRQLLAFFASCSSLASIDIHLRNGALIAPCETKSISSVKTIAFGFTNCTVNFVNNVCNALYFPEAKIMILGLRIMKLDLDGPFLDPRNYLVDYGAVASDILLQHCYTGLNHLYLDVGPGKTKRRVMQRMPAYLPPFFKLPTLEILTLSATMGWKGLLLSELPSGVRIPALRSLCLFISEGEEWRHISGWVGALITRLKEQGDLGKFGLLRVIIREVEMRFKIPKSQWGQLKQDICECISEPRIRVEIMDM